MKNTPRKRLSKGFFTVLISSLIISSIFFPGIVQSEKTEDKVEILVHKRGINFDLDLVRQDCSVIEEYEKFVLVKTTEEDKLALQREGYALESLENKYHVGLPSHSFDTQEGLPEIPEDLKIEAYEDQPKGTYIIQFIGPIKGEWKEELKDMGVTLHEFRHRFNFIVQMDPSLKDEVEEIDFVNWIGIYHPAYKFDHELLDRRGVVNLEISMFESDNPRCLTDQLPESLDISFTIGRNHATSEVEAENIELLAELPQVRSIQEKTQEYHLYNVDATWITETNEKNYRKLTEHGITGKGELITVMDSELYMEDGHLGEGVHEAWEDQDGNPVGDDHRKVQAWYVPGDSNAKLEYGVYHGTHVTGTVLGGTPPYGEYSNHDGNALDARLIFQDIDNEVWGLNPPSDMYNMGWGDAYEKDSRVHTNSWGGGDGYGGLGLEADEFLWDHKDFNILFAMANSGPDPNTLSQQAEGKNVISVGSVINYPDQDYVSSFSSRGYADDGRIKPTIMHVGEGVWSADRSYDGYQSLSGTSMATPGIAGQLGQIRQYYREGWHISGEPKSDEGFEPSNALVRATLINGAVEITGEGAYYNEAIFPNNDQGYGRTNLDRVLHVQGDERKLELFDSWDENITLDTGESWSMKFEVDDPSQELEVTLAWTDHPGSSGSNEDDPAIVNDLDLELETPGGTRYVGNAFTEYSPGYSEPDPVENPWNGLRDGEYDGLNVEENILLLPDQNGVEEGTYEMTVKGHNIPKGEQPFAVVITGGLGSSSEEDPPSIELTRPAGGEIWDAGEKEDIIWDTTSGDGTIEGIDIEYSTDRGDSWSYIEQSIQDTGSYTWSVPENSTEDAKVRLVVHDENGLSDQDMSDSFTIEVSSGPLSPTNPQPEDGSIGISTDPELSVYVEHEEEDSMDIYFYDTSDDSLIGEQEEVPSGTWASTVWSGLDHGTSYEWYAEAVDGEQSNISEYWKFTTVKEHTLTINIAGEGSTYPGEGNHNYEHEEEVTITANSEEHWYFVEWTGDYEGTEEEIAIEIDDNKEVTAVFEEHTYTISVNKEGDGSVDIEPDKAEYKPNEEVDLTALADEYWYFVEWTGDVGTIDDTKSNQTTITMEGDHEITAEFAEEPPEMYELTIDSTEGGEVIEPGEGTFEYENDTEVELEAVAEEGYHFVEWTGDASGIEEDLTITMVEDKDIIAVFEEYTYILDIKVEGEGSVDIEPDKSEYAPGEEVDLTAMAEEHWYFDQWTGDALGTEKDLMITMDEDKDITAVFEECTYILKIELEGEGSVDIDPDKEKYLPDAEVTLIADSEEDWEFLKWTGDASSTEEEITITMDENKSITAWFEEHEYELTFNIEGQGSVELYPDQETYKAGTEVELTAIADEHWYFVKWTGDAYGIEEYLTITMDEDKDITAVFEENKYTLDVTVEGEGSVDIEPDKTEYAPGEKVDLAAIAEDHWYFIEWTGDADTIDDIEVNETTIEMLDDYTIKAEFEKEVIPPEENDLTIKIEGKGTTDPDEGTHTYEDGTQVTLTVVADEGWNFEKWTGDYEGTEEEIMITMSEDKSITGHFEREEHNLIISVEGEGNTDPQKGTYTHKYGEEITVEAISNDGWYFSHWIGIDSGTEEDKTITITIEEDKEIIARFERKEIKEYTLKIGIIGEGSAKIDGEGVTLPYTEEYKQGTEVILEAIAGENWSFERWAGDYESEEKRISISIEEDMKIMIHQQKLGSAHFEVELFSCNVESNDGQGILLEIEYSIENTGEVEDTQEIVVYVNEEKEKGDEITLEPGEEYIGEIMLEVEEEEIYEIGISCEDDRERETIVVEDSIEEDDDEEDNTPSFSFLLLILSITFSILFYYLKKR